MIKKKLSSSDYFLIAANLVPVIGVWAWHWSPKEMFLIYCLETIIIGLFNIVKMAIVTIYNKKNTRNNGEPAAKPSGLFYMFFFLMHYGIFVFVQMAIFFGVSGMGSGTDMNTFSFIFKWPELLHNDSWIVLGIFVFCYCYKMLFEFLISGEYRTISLTTLMFQPYGRIFIQQITVIVGSMFLMFGGGKIFILVFAMVKIFFEVYINYESLLTSRMKELEKESPKK